MKCHDCGKEFKPIPSHDNHQDQCCACFDKQYPDASHIMTDKATMNREIKKDFITR